MTLNIIFSAVARERGWLEVFKMEGVKILIIFIYFAFLNTK